LLAREDVDAVEEALEAGGIGLPFDGEEDGLKRKRPRGLGTRRNSRKTVRRSFLAAADGSLTTRMESAECVWAKKMEGMLAGRKLKSGNTVARGGVQID